MKKAVPHTMAGIIKAPMNICLIHLLPILFRHIKQHNVRQLQYHFRGNIKLIVHIQEKENVMHGLLLFYYYLLVLHTNFPQSSHWQGRWQHTQKWLCSAWILSCRGKKIMSGTLWSFSVQPFFLETRPSYSVFSLHSCLNCIFLSYISIEDLILPDIIQRKTTFHTQPA